MLERADIDAVAIATPPHCSSRRSRIRALELGKPVFVEKPMAADLAGAAAMLRASLGSELATMIDFNFTEVLAWRKAKALLDDGAIGRLRHVVVTWNVENFSTRACGSRTGRPARADGGGALGNLVSHSLHYLEWFCGPIAGAVGAACRACPTIRRWKTDVTLGIAFHRARPAASP